MLRKIFLYFLLTLVLCEPIFSEEIPKDLRNSDEYIYILVHGITSQYDAPFASKSDQGKWIPEYCPGHEGTLVNFEEYLTKCLGLEGRVFGYSFSNPFGHPKFNGYEFGDPENTYQHQLNVPDFFRQNDKTITQNISENRYAAIYPSSWKNSPTPPHQKNIDGIDNQFNIEAIDPHIKDRVATADYYVRFIWNGYGPAKESYESPEMFRDQYWYPTGIEALPNTGNNWLKQAKRDYAKENYTDPTLWLQWRKRIAGSKTTIDMVTANSWIEAYEKFYDYIPKKFIVIAHSLGNLSVRTYLISDFYQGDIEKIISVDGAHLGSDSADAKTINGGPNHYWGKAAIEAFFNSQVEWRKKHYPVIRSLGFFVYLVGFVTNPKPADQDDLAVFSTLMDLMVLDASAETIDKDSNFTTLLALTTMGLKGGGLGPFLEEKGGSYLDGGGLATLPWADYRYVSPRYLNEIPGSLLQDDIAYGTALNKMTWHQNKEHNDKDILQPPQLDKGIPNYLPDMTYVEWMKNKDIKNPGKNDRPYFALISARGMPTPEKSYARQLEVLWAFPYLKVLIMSSSPEFKKLPTPGMKYLSLLMSYFDSDNVYVNDGSLVINYQSSMAQNVNVVMQSLARNKVNRMDEIYLSESLENSIESVNLILGISHFMYGLTGQKIVYLLPAFYHMAATFDTAKEIKYLFTFKAAASLAQPTFLARDDIKKMALSHTTIMKDITYVNPFLKKYADRMSFDKQPGSLDISEIPNTQRTNLNFALFNVPGVKITQVATKIKEDHQAFNNLVNLGQKFIEVANFDFSKEVKLAHNNLSPIPDYQKIMSDGSFDVGKLNLDFDLGKAALTTAIGVAVGREIENITHLNPYPNMPAPSPESLDGTETVPLVSIGMIIPSGNATNPIANPVEIYSTKLDFEFENGDNLDPTSGAQYVSFDFMGKRAGLRPKSITLKTDKFIVTGRLDDLLPQRMALFEYSLNFGPWTTIEIKDQYGNFSVGPLNLAEGQNVVTFRSVNLAGKKNWQMMRVIRSSTPLLPTAMVPDHQKSTSQNPVVVSVQYNDTQFEPQDVAGQIIHLEEFKIDDVLVPSNQVELIPTWNTYKYTVDIRTTQNLSEGEHTIVAKAFDIYNHSSYARWNFTVDHTAPLITIQTNERYTNVSSANINLEYTATDNLSSFVYDVNSYIQNSIGELVSTFNTQAYLSIGKQIIQWDGISRIGPPVKAPDGIYTLIVSAMDKAGNLSIVSKNFYLDSSTPKILTATFDHPLMSTQFNSLNLNLTTTEKSKVIVAFTQEGTDLSHSYMLETSEANPGEFKGAFSWKFESEGNTIPDGTYIVKLIPIDDVYLQGEIVTASVIIDRSGPIVSNTHAMPLVLGNTGSNPYQGTLKFNLTENSPLNLNKKVYANIELFHKETGNLVKNWNNYPVTVSSNSMSFDLNNANLPKGIYEMRITAWDPYLNKSLATAQVIKDGVPPILDFPKINDSITDKVTLIGIAQDPDWTNNNDFESYEVFIASGEQPLPSQLNSLDLNIWKTDSVAVPLANQKDYSKPNLSVRPQSYSGPIAILDTQNLPSGSITVLVTTSEKGLGRTSATLRKLNINKTLAVLDQKPLLDLVLSTKNVQFSNSEKIPFTILNSNAPAHIEIDIFDSLNQPIHHLAFQNVPGNPYFGKPDILYGQQAGLHFWEDELGFHLVLNGDNTVNHFKGSLVAGSIANVSHNAGTSISFNDLINFDVTLNAGESKKIDFQIANRNLKTMISFMHNGDFPQATLLKLGKAKKNPAFIPAMLDLKTPEESTLKLSWEGKNQTGGFGPSGIYRIKVSASGINGIGFSEASATFNVQNELEFIIGTPVPSDKRFNPFSSIDRINIPYNLSKEAYVSAKVLDSLSGSEIITLLNNQKQIGREQAYNLTWNGIYPNLYSQSRKTSGDYVLVFSATASDSSQNITITINNIHIISETNGSAIAELKPVGTTQNYQGSSVLSAYGDSSYFWSLFATGKYYPPKGFNYELQAFGTQNVKINPFVPFAGLAHRYFDTVKVKIAADVLYHWHGCYPGIICGGSSADRGITTFTGEYPTNNIIYKSIPYRFPSEFSPSSTQNADYYSKIVSYKFTSTNTIINFSDSWSPGSTADNHWGINNIYIKIFDDKGTSIIDEFSWNLEPKWGVQHKTSNKGIFVATVNVWANYGDYNARIYYTMEISLEQPIEYSRLTNRFVPWYGYVHKDIANQYDFHPEFNNANGLGFLGLNQMNGTTGNQTFDSYDPNLFPGSQADALTKINSFENLFKNYEQTWVTADPTYVHYLEGDHFEFIPITTPLNGGFVSMNSVSTSLNTYWRVYTHHTQDMDLKWPITYEETESLNNQQILAIKELKKQKDIEVFDLSNPHYQIDLNTVSYTKLGESFVPMNGAVYKKEGYTSPKLSEIFNLPPNVKQNTVTVLITKNIDSTIALNFNNNTLQTSYLSDSPVKAKHSGSFTPVNWTSDLDPLLSNGVLESNAKIFNEIDFSSLSTPILLASEYPFGLQNDLTFTGPHLFYKHDRNNIYSGQILNPNIEYDPWQIQIYDVTGSPNTSLVVTQVNQDPSSALKNQFKTKLKLDAIEKRFVKIEGKASGPYELLYFDGENWQNIHTGNQATEGLLGYWNVSRLSGKVTLALRVSENNQITSRTKDIYIGQLIRPNEPITANLSVQSPYKRAVVHFHPRSFNQDTFVSVTPVDLKDLKLETLPDIQSIGPIAEILPHGSQFTNGSNGTEDTRPTLVFQYSLGDIQELSGMGVDVKKLNVYYINESGGLDLADNVHSWSPSADRYLITAKLDHFSPYALLDGEIYPKPTLHASQKNVRTDQIQIYGKADPNRKLIIYLDDDTVFGDRDIKKISSVEKMTNLADFVLKSRKPGTDYLNYLTPQEKMLIQKQRDDAKLFNNENLQTEQLLEAQWQTEYETLQQNQIERLNKAINYILDQSIFNEATPVTTSITYTYVDENGSTQTTTNIVLIDPKLFDDGDRFSTRNIIFLSEINTETLTNNYHHFRPMKAIDYSMLNKKIMEAKEDYVLQGNAYQSFTTQTDHQGNYQYSLKLPFAVTQNHIFVTYDVSGVAKNRAIAHLLVGFDQSAPAIVSANVTPDFINQDSPQTATVFNIEINEYGKVGLNRFNPNGKLIDTQFLEGTPFEINKMEWKFSEGDTDGDYAYSLFMIDESGNTSLPVNGKIILDRRPPQILENNTLKAFNPANSSFNINLKTNEPLAKMDLIIKDAAGNIIYQETATKAPFSFHFAPSADADTLYSYQSTLFDRGNNTAVVTGTFVLDLTAPETPYHLKITHAFDQLFIESDAVSDNSLLGYSLFLRKSPSEIAKEIELKPTPQYLVKKPARDRFLYYSIKATDMAYNQSPTLNEKAIYTEADAVFKTVSSTSNEILLQDQFQLNVPSNADIKENHYVVHHLKSKNYRPVFAYSGFNPISDYYRAEVAYPRDIMTPLSIAFEFNATTPPQYNLTSSQIKIFRYDGSHWMPVTNTSVSSNKIIFDQTQLGYYVQTLPGVSLFADHNGPQIKFERLANNNLVPENLVITANLTDNDTAIDPSSFKLTVDSKQFAIPSSYFQFKDQYGREGTLIISIPEITGTSLSEGRHLISVECKDLAGNTNIKTIEVKHLKSFAVENPLNYPNPVLKGANTKFSFQLSQAADQIIVRVYSTTGRLVKEINAGPALVGYNEIPWDVRDNWGDYLANDVYLYTVIAKSIRGETVRAQGKLVVVK